MSSVAEVFAHIGSPLSDASSQKLDHYLALLMKWSTKTNLTGHKTASGAAQRLLPDGAYLEKHIPLGSHVLDIGAGAGALAVTLRVLRQDLTIRAVEPRAKRAAFLRAVRRELALEDFEVVEGRGEDECPGQADAAYACAVFPPQKWLPFALPLIKPAGLILTLTTDEVTAEQCPQELEKVASQSYCLLDGGQRAVAAFRAKEDAAGT